MGYIKTRVFIMNGNILNDYYKAIEFATKNGLSESLAVTMKQIYKLAQYSAINCQDQGLKEFFQILALLCKRFLITNEGLEDIKTHIQQLN